MHCDARPQRAYRPDFSRSPLRARNPILRREKPATLSEVASAVARRAKDDSREDRKGLRRADTARRAMADARRIANRPTGAPCSPSFRVRGPTARAAAFGSAAPGTLDATAVGGHPDASDAPTLHGRRADRRSSRNRRNYRRRRVEHKPKPAPRKAALGSPTARASLWLEDAAAKDRPWLPQHRCLMNARLMGRRRHGTTALPSRQLFAAPLLE